MIEPQRPTRQRRAVAAVLEDLDTFASAQQIHELLQKRGERVGLSTVYRTLQSLAESADVDSVRNDMGESLYRHCSDGHHHHLVCRTCSRTVEVRGPTVEAWANRVATENGFTAVSHTIEIFGTCSECAS